MSERKTGRGWYLAAAWAIAGTALLVPLLPGTADAKVPAMAGSKHDFQSSSSYRNLSALAGNEICRACHIPHNASKPRLLHDFGKEWTDPGGHVVLSQTMLCLSCHDGTIATPTGGDTMTATVNPSADPHFWNDVLPGYGTRPPREKITPGLNAAVQKLSSSWVAVSPLNPLRKLPLYTDGTLDAPRMACSTCHDPHVENGVGGRFLRSDQAYGDLCVTCHSNLYPR
jgi:predicted CXXCH cytochrome family protein